MFQTKRTRKYVVSTQVLLRDPYISMQSQIIVIEVSNLNYTKRKFYKSTVVIFLQSKKNTLLWVQRVFDNMERDVIPFNYHLLRVKIRKNIAKMSGAFLLNFHSIDNAV